MTLYISNRDGNGKTDEKGHYKFPSNAFTGSVVLPGLAVTQNSPLARSVLVSPGDFRIATIDDYAYTGWSNSTVTLSINTADPANPRIDTVVVYVDKTESTSPSPPNNPNVAKFMVIAGTPAGVPVPPNGTTIQTAVGANNPYIILADVRVNAGATTITNSNITDLRSRVRVANDFVTSDSILDETILSGNLAPNSVTTAKILDANVTTSKLENGAVTSSKFRPSIINSNFTPAAARFGTSATGIHAIPNCSMNYTAGPTNETLVLWLGIMAYKASGSANVFIAVNGVRQGTEIYIDTASPWYRGEAMMMVNVNANSTTTLAVYAANDTASGFNVTNEVARWMPTIRGFSVYRP